MHYGHAIHTAAAKSCCCALLPAQYSRRTTNSKGHRLTLFLMKDKDHTSVCSACQCLSMFTEGSVWTDQSVLHVKPCAHSNITVKPSSHWTSELLCNEHCNHRVAAAGGENMSIVNVCALALQSLARRVAPTVRLSKNKCQSSTGLQHHFR